MIKRLLLNDLKRNQIIAITLFLFIWLASLLMCSAAGIVVHLGSSLNYFFDRADPPHFLQMHVGEIDQERLNNFIEQTDMVESQQILTMLNIDVVNLLISPNGELEHGSVMDNLFVTQNKDFDFLLNLDNKIINVESGYVAVPVYYMQKYDLKLGDVITIFNNNFSIRLGITDFVRDAQMNPAMVSSKRFVVSEGDWNILEMNMGTLEHMLEFKLYDQNDISTFEMLYQLAEMPQNGPAITYSLLKVVNAFSDGMTAVIIVLVSLLLTGIALICLRLAILSSMEEDIREIGVMKAIGLNEKKISKLYQLKYQGIILLACFFGCCTSFVVTRFLAENLTLYMGRAPKSLWYYLLPILVACLVYAVVLSFCHLVLKRIAKITPVEAIRLKKGISKTIHKSYLYLYKNRTIDTNIFIGIKRVIDEFGKYGLLCFIFAICTFLFSIPFSFLSTVQSPKFIQYMGVVESDIRIDLRQSDDITEKFERMMEVLSQDTSVANYAGYMTTRCMVQDRVGNNQNIQVESGDFSSFHMLYIQGHAPVNLDEIALSVLAAKTLGKEVGDTLELYEGNDLYTLNVVGLYDDITNGGETAKALQIFNSQNVLWYVINVNLKSNENTDKKIAQYSGVFQDARITGVENYVSQTFGNVIKQLKVLAVVAAIISLGVAALITALFLKMLISKDLASIKMQRNLGIASKWIQVQYLTQIWVVLMIGFIVGIAATVTLGEGVIGILLSNLGAPRVELIIKPILTFVIAPLLTAIAVGIATVISCRKVCTNSEQNVFFE